MPRLIACCCAFLLACAVAAGSASIDPLHLGSDDSQFNLAGHSAWLKDDSGALGLAEVRARDDFAPMPGELSAGFTRAAVWLRFDLKAAAGAPQVRILEVGNALLNDVRLYTPQADGSWLEQRSGSDVPIDAWPVDYRNPAFRLQVEGATAQRFYLRIQTHKAMSAAVTLWHPDAFGATTRTGEFNYGATYSIYVLILVTQVFFWFVTRERLIGWYLPYVAMNFLNVAISSGHFQRLIALPGQALEIALGVLICMTLAVSNTFIAVQMDLGVQLPRFTRLYLQLMWVLGLGTSVLVVAGRYGAGVGAAQILSLVSIAVMVCIGLKLALKGQRSARFFLFAFSTFYAAVSLRFLRNLGLLEPSALTEYGVHVGALLHMVVMSLGIVGRYEQIRGEMLTAQTKLAHSLEVQVAERTATLIDEIARREGLEQQLRRALDVEVQARQQQQGFVAMVSHEFRTPLAIINTVAQQLATHLDAPAEKNLQRCGHIRDSVKRLTGMMDEFLALDRLGSDLRLNPAEHNVRELIVAVTQEWEPELLQLDCENLPQSFSCDSTLLRVALRNLVANAIRHSPKGCTVKVQAHGDGGGGIRIAVVDEGPGIPGDEIPQLFQKYFRGRAAQSQPGAGLGLFLVERIAQLHGGSVQVRSEPGKGSCFTLQLPPCAITPTPRQAPALASATDRKLSPS